MTEDKMNLRPYQQAAHDAVVEWVRHSLEPCLIEAATGAGKSHIIAAIAKTMLSISGGKHVLCLAPSAELVKQNREKYLATGNPASVYSASAGQKCLRHPVVFATPGTIKSKARTIGSKFCAVVLDEAHRIAPTIRAIIDDMKAANPRLRVIGLSATPYRTGTGYIYRTDETGTAYGPEQAIDPYFAAKVYTIRAHELIEQGYLTPPKIGAIGGDHYETLHMELNARGQFDASDVDRAFIGHGRKTAAIVADIVAQSVTRHGVMIFAATVQHAEEVMASLNPALSAVITGKTKDRQTIIDRYKARKIKYLVSVDTLTTGFDSPHTDVIALLRATESESLLQQIVGRGMRLCDGKNDFLVLDYAENLQRHCPDGDIFTPKVKTKVSTGDKPQIEVKCPLCSFSLSFSARPNEDGYDVDQHGYFVLHGQQIETDYGPMPAHYGRRCYGMLSKSEQCGYRWTSKPCPVCESANDIAARYCTECRAEMVDPNEKLVMDFKAFKKDPARVQTDRVVRFDLLDHVTQKGAEWKKAQFYTEHRSFVVYLNPEARDYQKLMAATSDGLKQPDTVTYRKDPGDAFYRVLAYGLPPDTPESIAA